MSLKIQTALIPQKHISFSGSLVGVAAYVRSMLKVRSCTLDELWIQVAKNERHWPARPSFEQVTIAVIILFALGEVRESTNGKLEPSA